jgi:hypothetical protein
MSHDKVGNNKRELAGFRDGQQHVLLFFGQAVGFGKLQEVVGTDATLSGFDPADLRAIAAKDAGGDIDAVRQAFAVLPQGAPEQSAAHARGLTHLLLRSAAVLDGVTARAASDEADRVDADLGKGLAVSVHPGDGQLTEFGALSLAHPAPAMARRLGAGVDVNDHEDPAVLGDEVKPSLRAVPLVVKHPHAASGQVIRCGGAAFVDRYSYWRHGCLISRLR